MSNDYMSTLAAYVNSPPRVGRSRGSLTSRSSKASSNSNFSRESPLALDTQSSDTSMSEENFEELLDPVLNTPAPTSRPTVGGKQPKAQYLNMGMTRPMQSEIDYVDEHTTTLMRQYATNVGHRTKASDATIAEACRFASASLREQNVLLFYNDAEIREKLKMIAIAWRPGPDAMRGIKQMARIIILCTKIPVYKGDFVDTLFSSLIQTRDIGLPQDWAKSDVMRKTVLDECGRQMTEIRSKLKGEIKKYSTSGDISVVSAAILKAAHINRTEFHESVELWARLAIWRQALKGNNGNDYWDTVDNVLQTIRKTAADTHGGENKQAERQRYINNQILGALNTDYKKYGQPDHEPQANQIINPNSLQSIVDNFAIQQAAGLPTVNVNKDMTRKRQRRT